MGLHVHRHERVVMVYGVHMIHLKILVLVYAQLTVIGIRHKAIVVRRLKNADYNHAIHNIRFYLCFYQSEKNWL